MITEKKSVICTEMTKKHNVFEFLLITPNDVLYVTIKALNLPTCQIKTRSKCEILVKNSNK